MEAERLALEAAQQLEEAHQELDEVRGSAAHAPRSDDAARARALKEVAEGLRGAVRATQQRATAEAAQTHAAELAALQQQLREALDAKKKSSKARQTMLMEKAGLTARLQVAEAKAARAALVAPSPSPPTAAPSQPTPRAQTAPSPSLSPPHAPPPSSPSPTKQPHHPHQQPRQHSHHHQQLHGRLEAVKQRLDAVRISLPPPEVARDLRAALEMAKAGEQRRESALSSESALGVLQVLSHERGPQAARA